MKKKILIILFLAFFIFSTYLLCNMSYNNSNNEKYHYVEIKNLITEVYQYPNGYDSYLEKFVSKQVYAANSLSSGFYTSPNIKRPIKISLKLNEINQHKINGKIYIYMIKDLNIYDSTGKLICSALDTPVIYTVTQNKDHLYIEKSQEFEYEKQVPQIYR
ncbi:hypothetical protein CPAST_c07330 [Clostridium pasteurianum DSM 525 = ATCC 6013]|uniref:Uncharacterized protein n=2 Tax=Clostridium pasteurianum TaxID=1501 RepID=A0A0H3J4I4_CLOPA|nr:hypothetical protein [Clostridium pasteurianum]AJA46833.1 hypothetical protein CPAST_c07330 [Clostridium pasteurianum DSM 525 = ATCC 6013]AJA50821.1 hypothetical protein CLPA_c07330 [Clostridium pasteurianum DSM 525 = ATCC 6013]AOZ74226.1 hypothetical protein AQ983_03535 [Clostridium pasteurianum DSM 525 = ATCC 6013]AOZ78024.1 hypothetical protein AQ984_03535 [Clostridium pasteurianum]ELP58556.1 hypothetical protein F502_13790 [Clostridium pasteurianum DSM 525 = ATCC 6013]